MLQFFFSASGAERRVQNAKTVFNFQRREKNSRRPPPGKCNPPPLRVLRLRCDSGLRQWQLLTSGKFAERDKMAILSSAQVGLSGLLDYLP